jgi:hypothetical protein
MSNAVYKLITANIKRDIDVITKYANLVTRTEDYLKECDWEDFDYWESYNDAVDLNFYRRGEGEPIKCVAYPVYNDNANYDDEYCVFISLEVS